MAVAELIKKRHFTDALRLVEGSDKKGADIIRNVLIAAKINGINQGYDPERFFVQRVTVGKGLSHKKIDIKGRGRHGTIKVPKSSVCITLEEKSMKDY
mmetsp:Transcript_28550/g.20634  ORF Transcript_28550/g.20634 Transcript_28550/m.20634 type:complete len:98 (+) Transcript_28550:306-599(+)|eukprot:CAMPEP_0116878812 /NCGR_PEP_ID=MMETSP0463-20121206/10567_1 /TAXON_ID=181622 /ORGANISM="Strombidinopsis sp, Strain SopsisLIS2011" /LENGTH=97 /DNA_ID=CAMNT_0004527417 /DNA_START=294 /DNA_END=587 /DNA_ORIENTATION=+